MYFAAILSVLSALSSTSLAQQIDPSTVNIAERSQWCTAQKTSCPLLCLQFPGDDASTTANDCDADTLVFHCVCAVNGMSPNASQFSQTIPYFECLEFGNQCVTGCGSDNACSNDCRANHPCGAQDPKRVNTSTATTHSQTATSSSDDSGETGFSTSFPTGADSSDNSAVTGGAGSGGVSGNGAAAHRDGLAASVGRAYGLAIVLGGVFAGFVLVL